MGVHILQKADAFCDMCQRSFGEAIDEPATSIGNSWTASAREARREMRSYGWVRRKSGGKLIDICPNCTAYLATNQQPETASEQRK